MPIEAWRNGHYPHLRAYMNEGANGRSDISHKRESTEPPPILWPQHGLPPPPPGGAREGVRGRATFIPNALQYLQVAALAPLPEGEGTNARILDYSMRHCVWFIRPPLMGPLYRGQGTAV